MNYHKERKTVNFLLKAFLVQRWCMEDYIQPTLRETPNHVKLHVGKNDVTTKQDTQQIAESIINLAIKIKRNCDVSICIIKARND